jgi:N-methylhydantoinase A/oxoprolinase/acetone carboxylase beta subunit
MTNHSTASSDENNSIVNKTPKESLSLNLGIDTGGTFTDGVLLEPGTRKVIRTAKVLTTHQDIRLCVAEVLDRLITGSPVEISLVSLSTTLATNAIAEGKRRPVALLLLGYDPELVHRFNFHRQFGTPHYLFIKGRHDLTGVELAPLDEAEVARTVEAVRDRVDAFAVASYAGPVNAGHEQRAAEIISGICGLPVVQAHHLSSELDSIRRATTASLNASLLANIQEFLDAVEAMLAQRGLRCPLMIVRGDGSIVKASFARHRPVEIIHSGPATSASGGQFLAGAGACLVVDIGGTTTDLSLVEAGKVRIHEKAATVGPYRTCVRTIQARSFGLGGDSLVRFDRWQNLSIGPERVLPISHLCQRYPQARRDLLDWLRFQGEIRYSDRLEYWILRREPRRPVQDPRTRQAIDLLRDGPLRMPVLLKAVGVRSPVQLHVDELINQEVIERAGLTPTDLLHVTGEYAPWDVESARVVAETVAKHWGEGAEAFARRVKQWMTGRIAAEIVQFLSGKSLSEDSLSLRKDNLDRWLFDESLERQDPYLGCRIFLKTPMVGIGAPAGAFLPAVAQALGAELLLPGHYEVANAVGTVVGSVVARGEADVFPCIVGSAITGYYARVGGAGQRLFKNFDDALAFARQALTSEVLAEVSAAGADGQAAPVIEHEERVIWEGMVSLSAWAVGKPG